MVNDLVVAKLGNASQLLAEAKTIQETKRIVDIATSAEVFARRQKLGEEAIAYATSIKIEALRQLGDMLKDTPRAAARFDDGNKKVPSLNDNPTLADLGLDKKISSLAQQVAELSDDEVEKVKNGACTLTRAVTDLKKSQKKQNIFDYTETVKSLPPSEKVYNVIYADPPWQYSDNTNTLDAVTDHHYATLPLCDIKNYLVDNKIKTSDDAVLFLWVTNPFLVKGLEVVKAWGFEYKTNIVWIKTELKKPGVGYYVRGRHELLFICTKGSFTPLDNHISPPIGSVLETPIGEHSEKPDEAYNIIERLYPGCLYLELFARRKRDGWDAMGDEA
jgi:N6-adenosine-specific RNA methylase IME4